jgi:hypothetical protein
VVYGTIVTNGGDPDSYQVIAPHGIGRGRPAEGGHMVVDPDADIVHALSWLRGPAG